MLPFNLKNEKHSLDGCKVAVVGAGIAGLVCARILKENGCSVTVLDKGRSPGGRLASRRREEEIFDYGAQYFTVRSGLFQRYVDTWLKANLVSEWKGRIGKFEHGRFYASNPEHKRYVGIPTMQQIAVELSGGLTTLVRHRVTELEFDSSSKRTTVRGMLTNDSDRECSFELSDFDFVILNMPPKQAAVLHSDARVAEVEMAPCLALMISFQEKLRTDFDATTISGRVLSWVARDSSKPSRPDGERWVLHASPKWSADNFDSSREVIDAAMLEDFTSLIGTELPNITYSKLHRWRFALSTNPLAAESIFDAEFRVGYCGDWCSGDRIEGAFNSGVSIADRILSFARQNMLKLGGHTSPL